MKTEGEIAAEIVRITSEQAGVPQRKITTETTFYEDMGFDSLDDVEMLMAVEDCFNLSINDEEAEKIKTVGQAAAFVHARLEAAP